MSNVSQSHNGRQLALPFPDFPLTDDAAEVRFPCPSCGANTNVLCCEFCAFPLFEVLR